MSGRVGRGGKAGGAKSVGGASGPAKASGTFAAKVDQAGSLVGPSGLVASSSVSTVGATEPVTAQALELIRQLRTGELKSRDDATKKLVADILKENVRTQSKKLADKIFEQLKEDPRLNQTLERLWNRAQEQE